MPNRSNPPPSSWWKNSLTVGGSIVIISMTAGFMEAVRVYPVKEQLNEVKERETTLKDKNNELLSKINDLVNQNKELRKNEPKGQKEESKKDQELLLFNGYEVSYNLTSNSKGDTAVGLLLSEATKNKIASNPIKTIESVVRFAPDQKSFVLWIIDISDNKINKEFKRAEGKKIDPSRDDERSFTIPIYGQKIDPSSIFKIAFESKNVGGESGKFIVKSVNLNTSSSSSY